MRVAMRVATEARRLAMQCVSGTAPVLIAGDFRDAVGRSCALGLVLRRSGGRAVDPWRRFYVLQDELNGRLTRERKDPISAAWVLVLRASNDALNERRQGAVVFPLLFLADTIEDALKAPKKIP